MQGEEQGARSAREREGDRLRGREVRTRAPQDRAREQREERRVGRVQEDVRAMEGARIEAEQAVIDRRGEPRQRGVVPEARRAEHPGDVGGVETHVVAAIDVQVAVVEVEELGAQRRREDGAGHGADEHRDEEEGPRLFPRAHRDRRF